LRSWPVTIFEDTTDAWSILVDSDSEVALLTPGDAPRVSDNQVIFTVLATIADSRDCMIKIVGAVWIIHDTTSIERERSMRSIDCDTDWLSGNSCLHLGDTLSLNGAVGTDTDLGLGWNYPALIIYSSVWIVCFKHDLVPLGVSESIDFHTATTSSVIVVAINQLLL
jgi:hypothetical protein